MLLAKLHGLAQEEQCVTLAAGLGVGCHRADLLGEVLQQDRQVPEGSLIACEVLVPPPQI